MPKQKIEIEVDVPDGWEATGEYDPGLPRYLILRRKEPVRESRWGWSCCSFSSYKEARATYPNIPIVREDLIDGKLVAVTLEPLGEEPQ